MLPKDPGMPKVERLRVIQLLQADYNFVLRIIWGRRLVWNAQKYGIYMPAQRAQPGNLCIAAALNKVLSYDLMRQTKKLAASFDNDAKGCYDNIVPPQAMVNCRRLGLPKPAAKILTTILNNTVYRIRTGHGISARTYQTNALRRILGTGQGSCASPSIWVSVLDPILWSIAVKYSCFQLDTPAGSKISRIGDAYVDDTSLMKTATTEEYNNRASVLQLTTEMEEIAQNFERKLFSTGGSLNLKKMLLVFNLLAVGGKQNRNNGRKRTFPQ